MDLLDFLFWFIKPSDWLALVVTAALGYLAGFLVPMGWWSILASMLLSYHLFLGWLLLTAKDDMQITRSLSFVAATHFVCIAVIVAIGMSHKIIPHFDVLCCGVAVLAFFESNWLLQPIKMAAPGGTQRR